MSRRRKEFSSYSERHQFRILNQEYERDMEASSSDFEEIDAEMHNLEDSERLPMNRPENFTETTTSEINNDVRDEGISIATSDKLTANNQKREEDGSSQDKNSEDAVEEYLNLLYQKFQDSINLDAEDIVDFSDTDDSEDEAPEFDLKS